MGTPPTPEEARANYRAAVARLKTQSFADLANEITKVESVPPTSRQPSRRATAIAIGSLPPLIALFLELYSAVDRFLTGHPDLLERIFG